MSILKPLFRW